MDTVTAHAVAAVLEARIAALWKQRQRDRRWEGARWSPARHRREDELRMLVTIARTGRRLARQAEAAKPDPMDQAKSFAEWSAWTEGELVAGFGR